MGGCWWWCGGVDRRLAMHRMAWSAGSSGPMQRRLGQRATHAAQRAPGGCGRALEGVQLPPEVGHRGVRVVLDPGPEHRGDQDCGPCGSDDEEDELSHVLEERSVGKECCRKGVEERSVGGTCGQQAWGRWNVTSGGGSAVHPEKYDDSTTIVTTEAIYAETRVTSRTPRPALTDHRGDRGPTARRSSPRGRARR